MVTAIEEPILDRVLPAAFSLSQNYPNPFNPETVIRYSLHSKSDVLIEVYSTTGNRITVLRDDLENEGDHTVKWNGKNSMNQAVSSGIYLCRIQAGKYQKTIRMLLLK